MRSFRFAGLLATIASALCLVVALAARVHVGKLDVGLVRLALVFALVATASYRLDRRRARADLG